MNPSSGPGSSLPAPPSDPAAAFAQSARERLGNRLAHCDETWLPGSDTPVLLAVVRDSAASHRAVIEETFRGTLWSGEKPALQQLAAAGMITIHTRASRPLLPADGQAPPPPLTPEERARIAELRALAEKKRRAAAALIAAGIPEEAVPHTDAAEKAEADIIAIEKRSI